MTREWQEASNQRLKELGIEPISGPASENYQVSLPAYKLSDISRAKVCFMEILSIGKIALLHTRRMKKSKTI